MAKDFKIKNITSLYESCDKCGLPTINCICHSVSKIKTQAKIWILTTENEVYRPSNTARLIKLINSESTEIFIWERTNFPEKLIENLNSGLYEAYLLFPAEDEETANKKVQFKVSEKIPAFIIIDGTWKEARKIFKKSLCLRNLKVISLEPNSGSKFDLRKGADKGELCTIETAIEVLKLNSEIYHSSILSETYDLFLRSFRAGVSGHTVKEEKINKLL